MKQPVNLKLLLCCRDVMTDSAANIVHVVGLLEEVTMAALPAYLTPFCILAIFERLPRESEKQTVDLKINLGEKELMVQSLELDFQGKPRLRNVIKFNMIPLPEPGPSLEVELSRKGTRLGSYVVPITQLVPIEAKPPVTAPAGGKRKNRRGKRNA